MKTNFNRSIGRIIHLAEEIRYFESKNSKDKIASLYGRVAIPQPVRVEVEGKKVFKDTIMDFQIIGQQAEFMDKYLRCYHDGSEEGKKKGGLKARRISFTWYPEQYVGYVTNEEAGEIELSDGETITFEPGEVKIKAIKTRVRIVAVDVNDDIWVNVDNGTEEAAPKANKAKNSRSVKAAPKNGKKADIEAESDDDSYEEIIGSLDDDDMPF